jgi:cytochrome c oxidase assembly protein Cox11
MLFILVRLLWKFLSPTSSTFQKYGTAGRDITSCNNTVPLHAAFWLKASIITLCFCFSSNQLQPGDRLTIETE